MLDQLLPLFSSRLIRNRATLGGNLVTASPIGDAPPVLLALDAAVALASAAGRRIVPLRDFFLGYRKTARGPDEVMIDVARAARRAGGPALLQGEQARARRHLDGGGGVRARGRGGRARARGRGSPTAASRRRRARAAPEEALVGQPWTPETAAALRSIADGVARR